MPITQDTWTETVAILQVQLLRLICDAGSTGSNSKNVNTSEECFLKMLLKPGRVVSVFN